MRVFLVTLVFCSISLNSQAQNIHRTACQGNIVRLDSMLIDTSINVKDFRGRSLMHWAVGCRKKEVFDYLVANGIDVNEEDNQKETPLHVAVRFSNETFFNYLLDEMNNNDWVQTYGVSLLEKSVLHQDTSFVRKLVGYEVDINGKNFRGSTALEISKRIGAQEVEDILLSLGANPNLVREIEISGPYMGNPKPDTKPQLLAPNFISTEEMEFSSVFNALGTEFYFGVDNFGKNEIRFSKMVNNQWTKPTVILSHEQYGYNDPFLSPNEDRLYFISNRSLDGKGEPKDIDIWYVEKTDSGWSEPINAGLEINTERDEYYISFTNEGTMYFSSDGHAEEQNDEAVHDIYYSTYINGEFQKPIALGKEINTPDYEADVFIAPDESYIIFASIREEGLGQGDLYISFKNSDGSWTNALNMGEKINSEYFEYCPFVTKDGKYLLYTSNQDIYWVSTQILDELKDKVH